MKKSKQEKGLEREGGIDMISKLPDHVLHLILSGLPTTEEVIRTSVFSKRWNYLWTSIPSLNIDYTRGLKPPKEFRKKEFKEFVDWVLVKKSLDLDSFRLCCSNYYNMSTVDQWIHAAVRRNVKVVDLMFHLRVKPKDTDEEQPYPNPYREDFEGIELPLSLVTCGSLEMLRLFLYRRRLSLPTFTVFPRLRVLELNNVELVNDVVVEEFFKSLPLLEDLSLIYCLTEKLDILCISCPKLKNLRIVNRETMQYQWWFDDQLDDMCRGIQISCPKLVFLELVGRVGYRFLLEKLDSLKTVVIHGEDIDQDGLSFSGIYQVESLTLNLYVVLQCLTELDIPASLPNLKTLELKIDDWSLSEVFTNNDMGDFSIPEYWHRDEGARIRIWVGLVKKVEFLEFNGLEYLLELICFFLEYGNALEEMVFIWVYEAKYHKESTETLKKVSNLHKASSSVKLIGLLRPPVKLVEV